MQNLTLSYTTHTFDIVGSVLLIQRADTEELIRLSFLNKKSPESALDATVDRLRRLGVESEAKESPAPFEGTIASLSSYLAGDSGTPQLPHSQVLASPARAALQARFAEIPYGRTLAYGKVAGRSHAQAVGQACATNPLPLILPCHRLVPERGGIGVAFIGGLEMKAALLELEQRNVARFAV